MSSPNGLVFPVVGDTTDTWGGVLLTLLSLLDNSDHSPGKGNPVPTAGLNINADLGFGQFAITAAKAVSFFPIAASAITSYSSAFFVNTTDANNLYFRNSAGTNVRIISGSQLDFGGFGGISGDFGAVGAAEIFTDSIHSYGFFQQVGAGVRQYGKLASADHSLYEFKVNGTAGVPVNAVTLKSPNALAVGYSWTWPAALPAATQLLTVGTGGALATDGVLGANTNITMSGTGYIKRGARTITCPPFTAQLSSVVAGGGVTTPSSGRIGVGVPASSTNILFTQPMDADLRIATITSVIAYVSVNGGSTTFTLHMSTSAGNSSAVAGASASTSLLSQYSPIVLTPTTPINVATDLLPGACFGLSVACAAGVTCNVQSMEFVTTVT